MMKKMVLIITSLNLIYFVVTALINSNEPSVNFFLLPFGLPAVIAFVLFFISIITLINENQRYISWLLMIINGLLMLLPFLVIVFI